MGLLQLNAFHDFLDAAIGRVHLHIYNGNFFFKWLN
jgi:hypothetical protein